MQFIKGKKSISILLCLALIVTTLAVCISIVPTAAAGDNLLSNASFETADKMWNSQQGKSGNAGYSNFVIGHGQNNLLADGWHGTNYHSPDPQKRIYINHSSDAHDGNYSLNVNIPYESSNVTLFPMTDTLASSAIEKGYYTLSVWVKSNNTSENSVIQVKNQAGTVYTQKITEGSTWHKLEIDGIYLEGASKHFAQYRTGWHIQFVFAPDNSGETTYITIDDVKLQKSENLLSGGSFEGTGKLWKTNPGYKDKTVAHGQSNLLADGWYGQNWWVNGGGTANALRPKVDHSKDAAFGSYSLKIKLPASESTIRVYPHNDSLNSSDITDGYYSFSIWVKSDNSNSYFEIKTTDGKVYKENIPVTDKWTEVTIDNIYLSSEIGIATTKGYQYNGPHILLECAGNGRSASYVQIDNAKLSRLGFLTNPDFEKSTLSAWEISESTKSSAELSNESSNGKQSVKLELSDSSSKLVLSEASLAKDGFTAGYYMWAFDVKGSGKLTAVAQSGEVVSEKKIEELTSQWKRYVLKDIDIANGVLNKLCFKAEGKAEIYIDNIEFYRQVGPGGLIDGMTVTQENGTLHLPDAPDGYEITVISSSNTEVLSLDGKLTSPETDTDIEIVLRISNVNDPTDSAKTEPFSITIKPFEVVEPPEGGSGGEEPETPPEGEDPPAEEQPENLLFNPSFENCETVWNSGKGEYGPAYIDKVVGHGQHNILADGWTAHNWLINNGTTSHLDICTTHTTDSHSGTYALKFTLKTTGGSGLKLYPIKGSGVLPESIESGKYRLTLWVKGTNSVSKVGVTDKNGNEYSASITPGDEWTQLVIDDIDLSSGLGEVKVGSINVPGIVISVNNDKSSSVDTELYIDDICLEKKIDN